jgi:uncharacterized protein with FMN-binding domain
MTGGLMALAATAVISVYAAGFLRTRTAAEALDAPGPRPPAPTPPALQEVIPALDIEPPETAEADPPAAEPAAPALAPARVPGPERPEASVAPAVPAPAAATGTTSPSAPATPVTLATPPTAPALPEPDNYPAPAVIYKDGTYIGWGTSRHGDIQATVVVEGGRIASAKISECWTRYPCSWIVKLPPQVAERQSPEVDFVSGATQSTNAFYYAVIQALSKAK